MADSIHNLRNARSRLDDWAKQLAHNGRSISYAVGSKLWDLFLVDRNSMFADWMCDFVPGVLRAIVWLVVAFPSWIIRQLLTVTLFCAELSTRIRRKQVGPVVGEKGLCIKAPPGTRLLRLSEYLFSKKTVNLTFRPLVADWQEEYFEALREGRTWLARCVSLRYYFQYAKACGLSNVVKFMKALVRS